jgi:hypothetical protein
MALGYLPAIPRSYYIAVCRAVGKISRAAAVLTSFSAIEIAAGVIGCLRGGAVGLVAALLVVSVVVALVTLPAVVRAALVSGRHRRGDADAPAQAATRQDNIGPELRAVLGRDSESDASRRARQQAGLAVLMSLSMPAPTSVLPVVRDD